jgi:lipopolysaccharide export system permease protein
MDIKESPRDFLRQRKLPEEMNIAQIKDYLFRLSKSGAHTVIRNLKVDLYQKIAFPFTSLVIVFVGIPFSLMTKKRASGVSSLAISAAICFLFYVSSAVSLALGKTGILPPLLAATSAHLAFIFLASYLIVKLP